jgi:hypothetical protein
VRSINGNGLASAFASAQSTATALDSIAPAKSTAAAAWPAGAGSALLEWISAGDDGFSGTLIAGSAYAVQWTTSDPASLAWSTAAAQVLVSTHSAEPGSLRSLVLSRLPSRALAFFRIWTKDEAGNWSVPSDTFSAFVSPFELSWVDSGEGPSLVIDRFGVQRAAYRKASGALGYAERNSAWGAPQAPAPGQALDASAAVDPDGKALLLFRDPQSGALKLARQGSSWSVSELEGGNLVAGGLASGPDGSPRAAYLDAALGKAKFLGLSSAVVDSASGAPALALDGRSAAHLAYASGASVLYASSTGSGWSVRTVGSGASPAVAVDSGGRAHLLYCDSGAVKYASWTGSGWSVSLVDSGFSPSLALDGDGRPHASYRSGGLKYAFWTGAAWSTMTVASKGAPGARSSIGVGPSGEVAVAFDDASDGSVKAALWAGGFSGAVQAPSAFLGAAASSTSIQWRWIDDSVNEAGFRLYGSTAPGGPFELVAGTQTLGPSPGSGFLRVFTEQGLSEGTTYYRYAAAVNAGGEAISKLAGAFPAATVDRTSPTITVNFDGDRVWRRSNSGLYDADFADLGGSGLSKFSIRASTLPGGAGPFLFDWIDTALSSDSYTDDWALPQAAFDALLDDATNFVTLRAVDGAGNASVRADAFVVLKDSSAPVLLNQQAGDAVVRASSGTRYAVFAFDAGSGLRAFQYSASPSRYRGDGAMKPWTDAAGLSPGATHFSTPWELDFASLASYATNYVSVRAVDAAGSTTTLIDAFFVLKDTAGPAVSFLAPGGPFISSLPAISGTAIDPGGVAGVEVRTSPSQAWLPASGTSTWTLDPGLAWVDQATYTLVARAFDSLGNYSAVYATASFACDRAAPSATLILGSSISALPSMSGTAEDPGSVKSGVAFVELSLRRESDGRYWDFNAEAWTQAQASTRAQGTTSWTLAASPWLQANLADKASYYASARAVDAALPPNEGAFSGAFFAFSDTAAPSAVLDFSAATSSSPGAVDLSWTAPGDDGGSGIVLLGEYRIHYSTDPAAGFSTASAQVAFSTSSVLPGSRQARLLGGLQGQTTYYLRVFLADDAGNWSPASNLAWAPSSAYPYGKILGHVAKASSEGITAVLVQCFDASGAVARSTFTLNDGSGTFVLEGLDPGAYKVQATWSVNGTASSVWVESVPMGAVDMDFVLNLGYSLSTLEGAIDVFPGAAAKPGFLAAAAAARYSGSRVELFVDGRPAVVAPAGPGGRWEISHLLPGKYSVRAYNGLEWSDLVEVEVGEGETKTVAFLSDPLPQSKVFAFPNPARTRAKIRFYTELAGLEAQVLIFDLSGTLVREIPGSEIAPSPLPWVYHADWDLRNMRGEPVASGVYLFMVKVRGGSGQNAKAVKKLAVIK